MLKRLSSIGKNTDPCLFLKRSRCYNMKRNVHWILPLFIKIEEVMFAQAKSHKSDRRWITCVKIDL